MQALASGAIGWVGRRCGLAVLLMVAPLWAPAALAQPAPPTQWSPSGSITSTTPTFTWQASAGATQYWFEIGNSTGHVFQSYFQTSVCSGGACSVTPAITLVAGSYNWWVQAQSSSGKTWGQGLDFTVLPPPAPVLISPSGSTSSYTPTFTWKASSGATQYWFEIGNSTSHVFQSYFQPSVCSGGVCSVTPAITLAADSYNWWVQAQSPAGRTWGQELYFTVLPPPAPVLVSPSGATGTPTPTFTWRASSGATQYWFEIGNSSGHVFQSYFQPSVCSGGVCSVTPAITLAADSYNWWVQAQSPAGKTWGQELYFTVLPPPAPILVSPSGSIDTATPVFIWRESAFATQYWLEIDNGLTPVFRSYFPATVCSGGMCQATPSIVLPHGDYTWYLQAQNSAGKTWSPGMHFGVLWHPARVRRDAEGAHFFEVWNGSAYQPTVLVGFSSLYMGLSDAEITRTLDLLKASNANLVRMWLRPSDGKFAYVYDPSRGRVNLDQFNDPFFRRVDSMLTRAEQRGIVVEVMIWDSSTRWVSNGPDSLQPPPTDWTDACTTVKYGICANVHHPNNSYSAYGSVISNAGDYVSKICNQDDPTGRFGPREWYDTTNDVWMYYQELYMTRLMVELQKHDNVTVEIMNEACGPGESRWRKFMHGAFRYHYPDLLLQSEGEEDDQVRAWGPALVDMVSSHRNPAWTYDDAQNAYHSSPGVLPGCNEYPVPALGPPTVAILRRMMWGLTMGGGAFYVDSDGDIRGSEMGPQYVPALYNFFHPPDSPPQFWKMAPNKGLVTPSDKYVLATSDASEILIYQDDRASQTCFTVGVTGSYRYRWFDATTATGAWEGWTDWTGTCFPVRGANWGLQLLKK